MGEISDNSQAAKTEKIYLSIDHLKKGQYELNILLKDKVVKSIKIVK